MPVKKVLRIFFIVLGALIALILVGAALLWIIYPGEYLRRLIVYGVADVYDYRVFPERPIQPSSNPFRFTMPADPAAEEARVKASYCWVFQKRLTSRRSSS